MKPILFSIVFPTYGVEKYIRDAIEDILSQTYRNFELIIVDDKSPDGSAAIASEYTENDNRVRLIRLPINSGVSMARNKGLEEAKGDYILFLDPDDRFEPDLLEKVAAAIDSNHPEVVLYSLTEDYYKPNGEKVYSISHFVPSRYYSSANEVRKDLMIFEEETLYGYPWNKAYSLPFLREIKVTFQKIFHIEDILFNIDVFYHVNTLFTLEDRLAHYRNVMRDRRDTRLTERHMDDYFELQMKRVRALYQQQEDFKTLDNNALRVLSDEYMRSFASSMERSIFDKRPKIEIISKAEEEKNSFLFKALSASFEPKGRGMKYLLAPIAEGDMEKAYKRAKNVSFVRRHMPGLFNRLKQER